MSEHTRFFTIPKLARWLGITPASVRDWIRRGLVEEPPALPVTGERAYPAEAARRIQRWYIERAARGRTRGPGASDRRERAQTLLRTEVDR
jgi:hypothetical protein